MPKRTLYDGRTSEKKNTYMQQRIANQQALRTTMMQSSPKAIKANSMRQALSPWERNGRVHT